jgi:phosphotransferase family enzyme
MVDPIIPARSALGKPVRAAKVTTRAPIVYDPYLAGRTVSRVVGVAELPDGRPAEWRAIVKRTDGPGLRAARRELAAYRTNLADRNPVHGLRAPELFAWVDSGEHIEVWLAEVDDVFGGEWPLERFGLAARHIAAFDAWAAERSLPVDFDPEDAWAERHGQPERVAEALGELSVMRKAPSADRVMEALDDADFGGTEVLLASTQQRIDRLAMFAQTPLHHDLVRSNLFALDDGSTAAIDWENVGRGPLGVDLAPLVVGSIRRGEASSDDLERLEQLALAGYLAGLHDAGIQRDGDVRAAYRLALGLRWHVVIGAIRTALDPTITRIRGSRPNEPRVDGLRHLLAVARRILEAA